MKKVVFISIFLLGLLLWQLGSLYTTVQADKEKEVAQQINYVQQETGHTVLGVDRFHGDQLYFVFTAVNLGQNEYSYIFLNESHQFEQISFTDIQISKEMAITKAVEKFPELTQIARVVPGLVNQEFVWEISGYDGEDNLHYIYFTMKDGLFLKRYTVNLLTK